jgi:autotransporter family porin
MRRSRGSFCILLAVSVLLMACLFLLAACGGSAGPAANASTASQPTGGTTPGGTGGSSPGSSSPGSSAPGSPSTPPSAGTPAGATTYFGTEPSHATYLPRTDAYCASAVVSNSWEPRPQNYQANHTVLNPPFGWATDNDGSVPWGAKLAQVTGNFTGTTTEILQWAACKWGIDENTIRAAAVQESYWDQSNLGDVCGPVGEASYGILQIKNKDCSGAIIHGGYPATTKSTALVADWYAARIRSCYNGDFQGWLYNGQTVDQVAAKNGWDYVFWACIGFHYSGNWSPGQQYQLQVQQHLANKDWEAPGF